MGKIEQTKAALSNSGLLNFFMPKSERFALLETLDGEEGEYMADIVNGMVERINNMPKTGETDGQGDEAIVHLHYFGGAVDAWVTEKDMGDGTDDQRQHQAFGLVSLGYEPELGYVSIQELIENGIELDLYWTPKPLKECE